MAHLRDYIWSVFHTVGDVGDFRYFLPRILDLAVHDRWVMPDREVILKNLPLAGWQEWPERERAAIAGVVRAAFEVALRSPDDPCADLVVDSWLCGWGMAGGDLTPLLELLARPEHEAVLCGFLEFNRPAIYRGLLSNSFWDQDCAAAARVVAWLESEAIQAVIERLEERDLDRW